MNISLIRLSGTALVTAVSVGLSATPSISQEIGGEFSVWGMGVIPTGYVSDGDGCDDGSESVCAAVLGWGGSGAVYVPLGQDKSLSFDGMYEFHFETALDVDDRDDSPIYGSVGVHLTDETNPDMPWGGFVFLASGSNNSDNGTAGPVAGLGAEAMVSGFTVQAGGMFLLQTDNNADDTLENLYFVGLSKEFALGNGNLTAGAMYGFGDFDEDSDPGDEDPGTWYQVSLDYIAPFGNNGMNWYAGYQGDFLSVDDGAIESAMFHSVKIGINIPIGGGAGPFRTPNFRVPLVNAGEFN